MHTHHPHHDALVNDDGSWKFTNRLADETSPYLIQHAHNPVDWHPWGEEAFGLAREQDKPIFLSIGYATCYWCHVMERQVFENPQIAAAMNEHFVNIKVDREERPDIDDLYMTATTLLTQRGGWPMSVFLTPGGNGPGLRPFYAGTYFPPEPQHGMPSFPQVIAGLSNAWQTQRNEVLEQATKVSAAVEQSLSQKYQPMPANPELPGEAVGQLLHSFDEQQGGFGGAPKFPQPSNLLFLLAAAERTDGANGKLDGAITLTLDRMARGGMYDQVGGGFHRYSTDARWLVPHFEKMLYDNGQLLECYAAAITRYPDHPDADLWRRVCTQTADYIAREMTDPDTGLFYAAQDAEVNASEGASFVWSPQEVDQAFADEPALSQLAKSLYGLNGGSNFKDPHDPDAKPVNVLFQPQRLSDFADAQGIDLTRAQKLQRQIDAAILQTRDQREQPGTDDKCLAGWNGLMIAGLARVSQTTDQTEARAMATRAAQSVWQLLTDFEEGGQTGLFRVTRKSQRKVPAFLEDYAMLARGYMALFRATGESIWLTRTQQLVDDASQRFSDGQGAFFDVREGQTDLFTRPRSTHDGALFSGISQMIHTLLDLYEATRKDQYAKQAADAINAMGQPMRQLGANAAHLQHALLRGLDAIPGWLTSGDTAEPQNRTEAHRVTAVVSPSPLVFVGGRAEGRLVIEIPEGMHAVAPYDSSEELQCISLSIESLWLLEVDWPAADSRQYPFADQPLPAYEGHVEIGFALIGPSDGSAVSEVEVTLGLQLCSETACQAPTTQTIAIELEQPGTPEVDDD